MAVTVTYSFGKISEFNEAATISSDPVAATDYEAGSSGLIMVRNDFRTGLDGDGFHWNQSGTQNGGFSNIPATNLSASGLFDSSNYVVVGQTPGQASGSLIVGLYSPQGSGTTFTIPFAGGNARDADVTGLVGGGFVVVNDAGVLDIGVSGMDVFIYDYSGLNATKRTSFEIRVDQVSASMKPSVAALDNGNFVIGWTENHANAVGDAVWFAIYAPDGTVARTVTLGSDNTVRRNISVTAINGGFAAVYETPAHSGDGTIDVEIVQYDSAGNLQFAQILTSDTPASIETPTVTRLSNGMLAITYGDNTKGTGDTDVIVKLWDPVNHQILTTADVANGLTQFNRIQNLTHDIENPTVAGFGNGKLGVFWTDTTAGGTAGQLLNAIRTTTGDASNNTITGDSLADNVFAGGGNDIVSAGAGTNFIDGEGGRDVEMYNVSSASLTTFTHNSDGTWTLAGLDASGADFTDTLNSVEFAVFNDRTVALREPTRADFDGSGISDMLWQNSDGSIVVWTMNGTSITGGGNVLNPGAQWKAVGSGDFNADGISDILLQNADGSINEWQMNGNHVIGGGTLAVNPGSQWRLVGSGDFNGDGIGDMLLQNTDGSIVEWFMNGTNITGGGQLAINPGASWKLVCSGNFNGDGTSDMLLQNTDGTIVEWSMSGKNVIGGGTVVNPGAAWKVINSGDFNGDGKSDLVLQNTDGSIVEWYMDGSHIIGGNQLAVNPGASWHVMGTRDYNNDGFSDLLLQNDNGAVTEWFMNGTSIIGGGQVATNPGASWKANGN